MDVLGNNLFGFWALLNQGLAQRNVMGLFVNYCTSSKDYIYSKRTI
jgi:hypothetical protein